MIIDMIPHITTHHHTSPHITFLFPLSSKRCPRCPTVLICFSPLK